MDKLLLVCVAVGAVLVPAVMGQAQGRGNRKVFQWNINDYPDPFSYDTYSKCGRYNKSNICDPNKLISREKADKIDQVIRQVFLETRCGCPQCIQNRHGYVIRVAVMPRMEAIVKLPNTTENLMLNARLYAYMLTKKWAMGGNCNESVLILFSRYDGVLYTLTLPLARTVLKDDYITRITLSVRHLFEDNETIGDGLLEMITRYMKIFERKEDEAFVPVVAAQRGNDAISTTPSALLTFVLTSALTALLH